MAAFRVIGFGVIVTGVCVAGVVPFRDACSAGSDAGTVLMQVAVAVRSGGGDALRPGLGRRRDFGVSQLGDDSGHNGTDKSAGSRVVRPDFVAPRFSNVEIHRDGGARVAGTCMPRSSVRVDVDGQHREAIVCDQEGRFDAKIGQWLGAGDHVLATTAVSRSGREWVGQDVRVSIPRSYRGKNSSTGNSGSGGEAAVSQGLRSLAEDLARAASDRFSELTEKPETGNTRIPSGREVPTRGVRVAGADDQSGVAIEDDQGRVASHPNSSSKDGTGNWISERFGSGAATVGGWVIRSGEAYDTEIVPKLSVPGTTFAGSPAAVVTQGDVPLPERGTRVRGFAPVRVELGRYFDAVSQWLERSHKDYQTYVARPLSVPNGASGPVVAVRKNDEATTPIDPSVAVGVVAPPEGRLASPELEAESAARSQADAARLAGQYKRLEEARPKERKQSALELKRKRDTALRKKNAADAEEQARQAALKAVTELNERLERERVERARQAEKSRLAALTRAETAAREKRALEEANKRALQKELEARQIVLEARRKAEADREAQAAKDRAARDVPKKATAPSEFVKVVPPGRARGVAIPVRNPNLRNDVLDSSRDDVGAGEQKRKKITSRASKRRSAKVRSKSAKRRHRRKSKKRRVRVARGTAVKSYRKRKRVKRKKSRRRSRKARTYVVRRGDTLWDIARRYYGDGSRYKLLQRANRRKVRNPNKIWPRQKLRLPRVKR